MAVLGRLRYGSAGCGEDSDLLRFALRGAVWRCWVGLYAAWCGLVRIGG